MKELFNIASQFLLEKPAFVLHKVMFIPRMQTVKAVISWLEKHAHLTLIYLAGNLVYSLYVSNRNEILFMAHQYCF